MRAGSLAVAGTGHRPALALGILAIVCAGAWLCLAQPIIGAFTAQRRELVRVEDQIASLQRIVAERAALERRQQELAETDATQRLTLAADSDGIAAASLQKLVRAATDSAGANLQSTQIKAVRLDGAFRRIGLRIQMTGTIEALRQTLLTLEMAEPLIYGESLELRSRQQARVTAKGAAEDRTLEIRIDVYGLARAAT